MRRLKDDYKSGDPVAALRAEDVGQVVRWLQGMTCTNGVVTHNHNGIVITPFAGYGAGMGGAINAAWMTAKSGALTVSVNEGDIELGPDTVIAWASITGATASKTISSGSTEWWLWVEVDLSASPISAAMFSAATIDPLTSAEQLTKRQKRIAKITIVDDNITKVQPLQCGNIDIPRAAG